MDRRDPAGGWLVVGASAAIVAVAMGTLFSLGVFLEPIERAMGWSRTGISTIALLNWLAMGLGSFTWGALSDRIGTRAVAAAGGVLLGLGLVLSSLAAELWHLVLTFGVLVGFAVGAFYAPLSATATRWFTVRRGLAVATVSAGIGVGVLLVAPLTRWLIESFGWRAAMVALGDLAWLVILPMAWLVRHAPDGAAVPGDALRATPALSQSPRAPAPVAVSSATSRAAPVARTAGDVFRTGQFWLIGVTHLACCAAHSGPIFHMVTNAVDHGVGRMAAATVFGVSGLASIAGRVGCGVVADRVGARPTLVAGLALQALGIALYLFVGDLSGFYGLAVLFGIAYGGVMPLYALIVRERFGDRLMGTAYGGVFLVSTLGMGLGSFAGGWLHDLFRAYTWLFAGSAAVGLAAVGLALLFRSSARAPAIAAVR